MKQLLIQQIFDVITEQKKKPGIFYREETSAAYDIIFLVRGKISVRKNMEIFD